MTKPTCKKKINKTNDNESSRIKGTYLFIMLTNLTSKHQPV